MAITFSRLAELERLREVARIAQVGRTESNKVRRATAALNGQVVTFHSNGKRTAETWARSDRWGKDGQPGIAGMHAHVHVCTNIKTARLKPSPIQRWTPPPVPEAYGIQFVGYTDTGRAKYERREIGTGAYDPEPPLLGPWARGASGPTVMRFAHGFVEVTSC